MSTTHSLLLKHLTSLLELPDSAYEKAHDRYNDLGTWLGDKGPMCAKHKPHVFPQGSFRLGTAIRPLNGGEVYDLDLACSLESGVSKGTHTQRELKAMLGSDLEVYRKEKGIKAPLVEKRRCWRVEYADSPGFHMDIVPSIPADEARRKVIKEAMVKASAKWTPVDAAAELAVNITDQKHPNFSVKAAHWPVSNPEGYARWFEASMNQGQILETVKAAANVDPVPKNAKKTVLQQCVQLLKRHRDQMFQENLDAKPISVIITTLAAQCYAGEADLHVALENILNGMDKHIRAAAPRVPNPVNPEEDFADKWPTPEGRKLKLEENFYAWLADARKDFQVLQTIELRRLPAYIKEKFSVPIDDAKLTAIPGITAGRPTEAPQLKPFVVSQAPARPWQRIS